jgi:hypothetical protein
LRPGGTLKVVSVHPQVLASFRFAGLASVFGITRDAVQHQPK